MPIDFTIAHQKFTPWRQVVATVVIALAGMLVVKISPLEPRFEYFVVMVSLVFFSIFNTLVSLAYPSFFRYTVPSYYLYIAMSAVLLLTAKFLSDISIWDLWEYRMMYLSLTVFYFVISVLVRIIRAIYELGEKGF